MLQRLSGVVALTFLVIHLHHTWLQKVLTGAGAALLYEALRTDLGTIFYLIAYGVGIASVAFHVGYGLPRAWVILRGGTQTIALRIAGAAAGVFLFVAFISSSAHMATGRALFMPGEPVLNDGMVPRATPDATTPEPVMEEVQ